MPRAVIAQAGRLALRFARRVRDVDEGLADRGGVVSSETVRRWVATCGAYSAEELRRRAAPPGRPWHVEALAVRVGGALHEMWRAVDEHGATRAVLLPRHRDPAAGWCVRR